MLEIIDTPFVAISNATGFPLAIDQAKAATCLILAYPLGILFSFLKGATLRYSVSLALGILFQLIVYGYEMVHTFILTTLVYILMKKYQRRCVKSVTITVFFYTSCYHVYRMYKDWGGWRIDMSFVLMMAVSKFTSLAWCYRDGGMPSSSLSEDQKYRRIEQMPTYFELLSYILFFPSAIMGPFFDFKDFQLFITQQERYSARLSGYKIGALMLMFGLLSALGRELFTPYLDANYILTTEYASRSIFYRIGYLFLAGYVVRLKYFTGFYLGQSGVDASGLSYSGIENGKHTWETVTMCGRYSELCKNAKQGLEYWNSSVQVWLKRYIYNRMIDADVSRGRKPDIQKATWTTFAVSAFWHGFYPSYYTTFFIMWSQLEFGRAFFRAKDKLKLNKYLYAAIDYFVSILGFGYAIINHVYLDWNKSLIMYQNTWFIPVILPLSLAHILKRLGASKKPHSLKEDKAEAKKIQ